MRNCEFLRPSLMKSHQILVVHGPNLNMLGVREPEIYGKLTLSQINDSLFKLAAQHQARLEAFQSNFEGEIVSRIQQAHSDGTTWVIINAGAYTHTSVAIRDALCAIGKPFIEVHLSNVHQRESFRHHSYLSDVAKGVIVGLGAFGYEAALQYVLQQPVS